MRSVREPPTPLAAPVPAPDLAASPMDASGGARAGAAREALALLGIALPVLALFRDALFAGLIPSEGDTRLFYYPLMSYVAGRLKAGDFPLWSPGLFGGYPVFSDGEAGTLYPLNLLLLPLPTPVWFAGLSGLHFLLAGAFGYLYGRSLRLARIGAVVVGLVFSLGGFLIAQAHHTNVVASAIWLPAILACVEGALRATSPRGLAGWVTLGGLAYAMTWLGVHIQPAIMTSLLLAAYVPFRAGAGRPIRAAAVLGGMGLLGLGLAAVQALPLWELGSASRRGEPQTYDFASSYATPLYNLVTLLVPGFFRAPSGEEWALWPRWEIALYVGVAPLLLAPLALLHRARRRLALFWSAVALGCLWLAFGYYAPAPLYGWLWQLPGFAYLRAPGRFSYLLTFGVAALAGIAVDWLASAGAWRAGDRRRLGLAVAGWGAAGIAVAALWLLARDWLLRRPERALALIEERYLALPHAPIVPKAEAVDRLLLGALSPERSETLAAAALFLLTLALLGIVCRRPRLAPAVAVALALLTAVDLVGYGHAFHPQLPLAAPSPAARFLAAQAGDGRLFAWPGTSVEPDQLLPLGVPEIGGYSSLQSARHIAYTTYLRFADGPLLDLAGVRWVATATAAAPFLSYEGAHFDVPRPLFSSGAGSPGARATFHADATATELRVVSRLQNSTPIGQGETVATIAAWDDAGGEYRWPLRAGLETAEWAWERADVRAQVGHDLAPIAYTWRHTEPGLGEFPAHLYFARLPLPARAHIVRVEMAYTHRVGRIQVSGLGLADGASGEPVNLSRFDNARFRLAFEDGATRVWENGQRLPRAFLVAEAVGVRSEEQFDPRRYVDVQALMAEGDFDVARAVIVEDGPPDLPPAREYAPGGVAAEPGRAAIVLDEPERTRLTVSAPGPRWLVVADAYDPGWSATVDGLPAPLYRGDSLFRALPVPAGEHTVELRFRPAGFVPGLPISLATGALLAAGWAALLLGPRCRRRQRG